MRVLVVELDGGGHRFYHVRLIASRALERGDSVTLLTGRTVQVEEHLAAHLAGLLDRIDVRRTDDTSWAAVEQAARDVDADVTVVPEADHFVLALVRRRGWRGPGRLSLQIMRGRITRLDRSIAAYVAVSLGKRMSVTALGALPRVGFHVMRGPLESKRAVWPAVHDPTGLVGDAEDDARLRADWRLDGERYWFAVLGAVTPNKHLDLVTEALCRARTTRPLGLLVAGRVSPEVAGTLPDLRSGCAAAGVELRVVDRLLSDVELDSAVRVSDCLVLAYDHNGPSGLFGKAVAAGTRIVCAGSPALRRFASRVPMLAAWSPMSVDAVRRLVERAATQPRPAAVPLPGETEFADTLLNA